MLKLRQKRSSIVSKPTHLEQSKISPMQQGDNNNPFVDRQEESTLMELELKLLEKAIMLKRMWQNPRIF
jgi:hypothetical protein